METMIVEITRMKVHSFALSELVHQTVFAVRTTDAYQPLGIAMVTMTAVIKLTSQKIIAKAKSEHVLAICSPVTMAIVFRVFTYAMEITIV